MVAVIPRSWSLTIPCFPLQLLLQQKYLCTACIWISPFKKCMWFGVMAASCWEENRAFSIYDRPLICTGNFILNLQKISVGAGVQHVTRKTRQSSRTRSGVCVLLHCIRKLKSELSTHNAISGIFSASCVLSDASVHLFQGFFIFPLIKTVRGGESPPSCRTSESIHNYTRVPFMHLSFCFRLRHHSFV